MKGSAASGPFVMLMAMNTPMPPIPPGGVDLSQLAHATPGQLAVPPAPMPNQIGVKFPGGVRTFSKPDIDAMTEEEFRLFVMTIISNNPMDPDFQRVFGPPADDEVKAPAAPITEGSGGETPDPFEGFTPEFDYERVGDLFGVDDRTVAQAVKFRGEPLVVLAVLPDAEDIHNDNTVTRFVHIDAETAGRILKGMHPEQTPVSAPGGDGDVKPIEHEG